jgi:hypothetical protein
MSELITEQRVAHEDRRAIPPQVDRRKADDAVLVLVQLVHADVQKLKVKIDEVRLDESLALAEAVATLMVKAFPEGDPDGHKAAHEADIQAAKDRAEFWKKMRFELSRAGLLGFLVWAGVQIWKGALAGPQS